MIVGYFAGFGQAGLLTAVLFYSVGCDLVWQPCIPVALGGAGLCPDGRAPRLVPALAFGVLIVILLLSGSLWIMAKLDPNMLPTDKIMQMQR